MNFISGIIDLFGSVLTDIVVTAFGSFALGVALLLSAILLFSSARRMR